MYIYFDKNLSDFALLYVRGTFPVKIASWGVEPHRAESEPPDFALCRTNLASMAISSKCVIEGFRIYCLQVLEEPYRKDFYPPLFVLLKTNFEPDRVQQYHTGKI